MPYPMNNKILFFLFCLLQHQILSAAQAENTKTILSKEDPNSILYSSTNFWWGNSDFTNLETLCVQGESMNRAMNECLNSKLHAKCELKNTLLVSSLFNDSDNRYNLYYKSTVRGYSSQDLQEMRLDSKNPTFSAKFAMISKAINYTLLTHATRYSANISAKIKCESNSCDYCMFDKLTNTSTPLANDMYRINAEAIVSCYKRKTLEELRIERFPELNELPVVPSIKETGVL